MSTVSDDFSTGTSGNLTVGTDLNGRTVSSGTYVWSCSTGIFKGATGGGKCTAGSAGRDRATVNWTPSSPNYTVQGAIFASSAGKTTPALLLRDSGSAFIIAEWNGGDWKITSRDGGGDHSIKSGDTSNSPTTARAVVFTISGSNPTITISLTVDGNALYSSPFTYNPGNTNFDAAGSAGIASIFADGNPGSYVDDWQASDAAVGGTPLRRNSSLTGLGSSGPFFHDPLSMKNVCGAYARRKSGIYVPQRSC